MNCPLCLSAFTAVTLEKSDPHLGRRVYRKCSCCHLIFLLPEFRLKPQEEKARYDLHQNDPDDPGYVRFLRRLADPLCLKLEPGFRGLDFGCGPSPVLSMILKAAGCSVDHYDPYYFPDEDVLKNRFDFVACSEVIEHFYAPRESFLLLDGLLKSERSYLGIMTEVRLPQASFRDWWYHRDPAHVCFYQKETFEWLGAWRGWRLEFPQRNVVVFSKGSNQT